MTEQDAGDFLPCETSFKHIIQALARATGNRPSGRPYLALVSCVTPRLVKVAPGYEKTTALPTPVWVNLFRAVVR